MSKVYTGFDCVIKFRCSDSLKAAIVEGAKLAGMDVSTYIRACLWQCCPLHQNAQNNAIAAASLVQQIAQSEVLLNEYE